MPKRLHGAHNKKVCDKLHLQEEFKCTDWVITTAFYSSIHYIDHVLFPVEHKGVKYKNINEASKALNSHNKHQARAFLVSQYLKKHDVGYRFLVSECHNARYVNYDVDESVAKRAVRELESIIKECNVERK